MSNVIYAGIAISVFFILLGILLTLSSSPSKEQYLQGNSILFIGILGFYTLTNYIKKRKSIYPEEIIFDNKHGYLEIIQEKEQDNKGFIPYEEIDSFKLHEEQEKLSDYGQTIFIISLIKKDGGIWNLMKFRKEREASDVLKNLKTYLDFSQKSSPLPFSLSGKLEKAVQKKYSELKWKNPVKKYLIPFTISVFLIFGFLISLLGLSVKENTPVIAFIIIITFLLLTITGIIVQVRNFLKDSSLTYGIRINSDTIEFFEEHYSGRIIKSRKIGLDFLIGIVFSFKPEDPENLIQIQTREDLDKEKQNGNLNTIKNRFLSIFGLHPGKLFLNTKELNTVEKLQLENWLQENIKVFSGFEGKTL